MEQRIIVLEELISLLLDRLEENGVQCKDIRMKLEPPKSKSKKQIKWKTEKAASTSNLKAISSESDPSENAGVTPYFARRSHSSSALLNKSHTEEKLVCLESKQLAIPEIAFTALAILPSMIRMPKNTASIPSSQLAELLDNGVLMIFNGEYSDAEIGLGFIQITFRSAIDNSPDCQFFLTIIKALLYNNWGAYQQDGAMLIRAKEILATFPESVYNDRDHLQMFSVVQWNNFAISHSNNRDCKGKEAFLDTAAGILELIEPRIMDYELAGITALSLAKMSKNMELASMGMKWIEIAHRWRGHRVKLLTDDERDLGNLADGVAFRYACIAYARLLLDVGQIVKADGYIDKASV
eukprot:TRINITY_DN15171_c0_g1_i1.p1 TRINITY_DN15171_c0_g1~~TRINITY_DN15171_c0_g1_i1.p1  ORF type:complete len:353 (+),score=98.26 TRINITY_DN15171_c0_g1_i1:85-1143(+)